MQSVARRNRVVDNRPFALGPDLAADVLQHGLLRSARLNLIDTLT